MREPKIAKQMSTSDAWVNYILFFEPDIISKLIHLNWALLSSYFSHFIADRAPFFIEWLGYIWKRQKHLFEWRSLHFVSRGFQAITIKAPLLRKVFFSCHNNRRKKSGCLLLVFKPLLIRRIRIYGGSSKQILFYIMYWLGSLYNRPLVSPLAIQKHRVTLWLVLIIKLIVSMPINC